MTNQFDRTDIYNSIISEVMETLCQLIAEKNNDVNVGEFKVDLYDWIEVIESLTLSKYAEMKK